MKERIIYSSIYIKNRNSDRFLNFFSINFKKKDERKRFFVFHTISMRIFKS